MGYRRHMNAITLPAARIAQEPPDQEFSRLCASMGWSYREVARRLDISESTPRQWASGRAVVPPSVLGWMRRNVGVVRAVGLPEGWARHGSTRHADTL